MEKIKKFAPQIAIAVVAIAASIYIYNITK
jgi:hypothetical protein